MCIFETVRAIWGLKYKDSEIERDNGREERMIFLYRGWRWAVEMLHLVRVWGDTNKAKGVKVNENVQFSDF